MSNTHTLKTLTLIILCFLGLFQGTAFSAKKENCIAGKGKVCQQPPSSIAGAPNPNAFRINNAPTSLNVPNTFTPTTSGGLGSGSVSYSSSTPNICEVVSNTVRANTPGTCTITATKKDDSEYGSATNTISFSVNPAPPVAQSTVTLTSSASSIFSGGTVTLTASGGNGTGALSLSGSGSCSLTAGDVSNEEARATLTGTNTSASATTCSVTATRAASEGYLASNPSSPVTISINPLQTQAPLNFDIASLTFTNNIAVLNASGGSGNGAITYASNTPSYCTVSGSSLTRVATGECRVTATRAASGTYRSISVEATRLVNMNPCPGNVDFCNPSVSWSESPRRSGVTSITVSFKANETTVTKACLAFTGGGRPIGSPTTISGSGVHMISGIFGDGSAVSPGGLRLVKNTSCDNYPASGFAPSPRIAEGWATGLYVTDADALGPQASVGAATNPNIIPPGTTAQITGTGGSGNGAFIFQSSTPSICTISGSTITGVANGTCSFSVTRAASGLYLEATANVSVTVGCAVNKQIEYRNDSSCTLAATTDLGQACVSEINPSGSIGTYNGYSMLCYSDKQCLYVSRAACGDGTCDSPWELRAYNQIYPSATASQIRSGSGTSACKVGNW